MRHVNVALRVSTFERVCENELILWFFTVLSHVNLLTERNVPLDLVFY